MSTTIIIPDRDSPMRTKVYQKAAGSVTGQILTNSYKTDIKDHPVSNGVTFGHPDEPLVLTNFLDRELTFLLGIYLTASLV